MEPLLKSESSGTVSTEDELMQSQSGAAGGPVKAAGSAGTASAGLIRAEEGGGDAHTARLPAGKSHINNETWKNSESVSPVDRVEASSELLEADSNPECDMEGVEELPLDEGLPSTVRVLETARGGRVYLVGTAHFSRQSQDDVVQVIQKVSPHVVMVELCEQRTHILLVDEETILREAKTIDLQKIRSSIAQSGVFNGLMYILLLNMSAHLTRKLGMAPGGEFRTALLEAKKLPNCVVQLGDRAIDVTLQRALSSLSWMQSFRLVWHLLTTNMDISAEDVEKCKQKSMLEDMLEEMAGEFPTLKHVFVEERDVYLAHSLQLAAMQKLESPCRIVGVVGIGHVEGIVKNWGKVSSQDIPPLLRIPPPALSTRVLRVTLKLACAGAVIYAGYKLLPRKWLA